VALAPIITRVRANDLRVRAAQLPRDDLDVPEAGEIILPASPPDDLVLAILIPAPAIGRPQPCSVRRLMCHEMCHGARPGKEMPANPMG
jgi:hypothetical protein